MNELNTLFWAACADCNALDSVVLSGVQEYNTWIREHREATGHRNQLHATSHEGMAQQQAPYRRLIKERQPRASMEWVSGVIGFESEAPLAVSQVDATTWETTDALVFHGSRHTINVPIGSTTDWASVPTALTWLVPRLTGAPAAVTHDHAYRVLCPAGKLSYRDADRVLSEALASLGIPAVTRLLMWCGVRIASITTRPGGWRGCSRDLPAMVAIFVPGLLLAIPAVLVLPSMALLAALNYIASTMHNKETRP